MINRRILVFIPCYNCAPQIGRVLSQFSGAISSYIEEIIVVDNGSRDGTVDAAMAAIATSPKIPIKIVRNRENYNLGGSHKAAFRYAQVNHFSHVLVLHGDDQGNVNDILPVLQDDSFLRFDAVLGARFMRGSRLTGYSTIRTLGNRVMNGLFGLLAGHRVYDLGSGLNIFGREVFTDPDVLRFSDDLRFNVYMLLGILKKKRKTLFVPISWREEDQVSNVRLFSQTLRTFEIAIGFLCRPGWFRSADHRDKAYPAYAFDVLASSGNVRGRQ